jgi:hypothetical protein
VSADLRAERARAYLAGASGDVTQLPRLALEREAAEARRVVAWLLTLAEDVETEEELEAATHVKEDGQAWLVAADVLVLIEALPDAVAHRSEHAEGECSDCDTSPAGLCAQGAGDLDVRDRYLSLARSLGIGVDR